jgi:hypothetical protein
MSLFQSKTQATVGFKVQFFISSYSKGGTMTLEHNAMLDSSLVESSGNATNDTNTSNAKSEPPL